MRLAGIYGLVSLSEAPLADADAAVLGLDRPDGPFMAVAHDPNALPGDVGQAALGDDRLLLLGRLDDSAALAAELGCASAAPAALALAALRRWGSAARARMPGEWSLVWWQGAERTLTLGVSENLRDPLLFAWRADRVAWAPDVRVLAGIDWVDGAIDPEGLAYAAGRMPLRLARGGRTVVRDVTALDPGTWVTIDRDGPCFSPPPALRPATWSGGFGDAVADLEHALRESVRRLIAGHARIGVLLSGGLDSSLLAALAAEELGAGQSLTCFTSAAPEGSDLVDEMTWSHLVADRYGLPVIGVCPGPDPSIYLPSPATFANSGPIPSPRHYLYQAFADAGRAAGIEVMLDGVGGESSITRKIPVLGLRTAPAAARQLARLLLGRIEFPDGLYHARFTSGFLAALPQSLHDFPMPRWPVLPAIGGGLYDLRSPVHHLGTLGTAAIGGGLRQAYPFRDRALLALAAAVPGRFTGHGGAARAVARAMLAGKVPETVRLRPHGLPISPDYHLRMSRDVPTLQARLSDWRSRNVASVIDLDWLEANAARRVAGANGRPLQDGLLAGTAHIAGFIAGWRD